MRFSYVFILANFSLPLASILSFWPPFPTGLSHQPVFPVIWFFIICGLRDPPAASTALDCTAPHVLLGSREGSLVVAGWALTGPALAPSSELLQISQGMEEVFRGR